MSRRTPDPKRIEIGGFWLWYRADRSEWCIAWYDKDARSRRLRSTGIGGGCPNDPPSEAREALARHFLESVQPAAPKAAPTEVAVGDLLTVWLKEHVEKHKAAPERYAQSVPHLLRYFAAERKSGRIKGGGVMLSEVNRAFVLRFIEFRKAEGVGGHTISRDLAALRGAINHAWKNERIAVSPFIPEVDKVDKAGPRELVLTTEQVAALLEQAARRDDRRHVLVYTMIQLSTCGRTDAIIELEDAQIRRGLIYFLAEGETMTSKRRSIVPIAPTLAPWLAERKGKIISYRVPVAAKKRIEGGPTHVERPTYDLGKAFAGCLCDAALAGVSGITKNVVDKNGSQLWLPPRRSLGETVDRPRLQALATPNTLRHTAITEMNRRGVPDAQIDTAAGHIGEGTGKRNYRHLRPEYLAELISAVEGYWSEVGKYTTVHLRTHCGPKIVDFGKTKAGFR